MLFSGVGAGGGGEGGGQSRGDIDQAGAGKRIHLLDSMVTGVAGCETPRRRVLITGPLLGRDGGGDGRPQ